MCVRLYQESVCKEYRTRLQSSATGFFMPDQCHFPSLYSYSLEEGRKLRELFISREINDNISLIVNPLK